MRLPIILDVKLHQHPTDTCYDVHGSREAAKSGLPHGPSKNAIHLRCIYISVNVSKTRIVYNH